MKKPNKVMRATGGVAAKRQRKPKAGDEEERILRAATIYLIRNHGMFLVATGIRATRIKGIPIWIVAVTLRYTTGHEGYIGDLLYDGQEFSFLTPPEVRKERTRQIADDPERERKWNEYRAATLPAGKR